MTYLALIRHGETAWNRTGRFTGWADEPMTLKGEEDARAAGLTLARSGVPWHLVHTSTLQRSIDTAAFALRQLPGARPAEIRDWRLNERHVGDLEGGSHAEAAATHGPDQVEQWRWGWDVRPPTITGDDPRQLGHHARHPELGDELPVGESLQDVVERVRPWLEEIRTQLSAGLNVVAFTHGTTLRALRVILEGSTPAEAFTMRAANGAVVRFELAARGFRPASCLSPADLSG
ncbi:2,3-bisphosphoglycerate-dependent phosphoglycerate mutase [Streptacidiphilus sp. MAP12-33]|uniref:2,3-bisphosphoglycerate-dependent phosphoglycerate mutase n=1 Tax=Streptacidiphilus sp. MAP12-33 TaxID=3156266 RepID=UPI0035133B5F